MALGPQVFRNSDVHPPPSFWSSSAAYQVGRTTQDREVLDARSPRRCCSAAERVFKFRNGLPRSSLSLLSICHRTALHFTASLGGAGYLIPADDRSDLPRALPNCASLSRCTSKKPSILARMTGDCMRRIQQRYCSIFLGLCAGSNPQALQGSTDERMGELTWYYACAYVFHAG